MTTIRLDPCPMCGKPPAERYKPFCSARCADADLGRWLTGAYAIPVPDDELDPDDLDALPPGHGPSA